jgi:hypothetical protein
MQIPFEEESEQSIVVEVLSDVVINLLCSNRWLIKFQLTYCFYERCTSEAP